MRDGNESRTSERSSGRFEIHDVGGAREHSDLPGLPGLRAILFGEQDVVVGVRIKRQIEVDQVDGLVIDVTP
jgi:hypothetical protein